MRVIYGKFVYQDRKVEFIGDKFDDKHIVIDLWIEDRDFPIFLVYSDKLKKIIINGKYRLESLDDSIDYTNCLKYDIELKNIVKEISKNFLRWEE